MAETRSDDPLKSERLVPSWLDNLAALGWRVLAIAGFVLVLWYLATLIWNVLLAIGLAVVVTVILAPLVLRLRAGGRSRSAAASIAWIATLGVSVGVLLLIGLALLPYLVELFDDVQQGRASVEAQIADADLPTWLSDVVTQLVAASDGVAGDTFQSIVGNIANLGGILLIGAFLLFFFLKDGDKGWLWLFQSMPDEKRHVIDEASSDALERVGNFVRARTVLAAIAAITNVIFMLPLGTPLVVPLAVLSFVLGYVPYFGSAMAAIVIALVTLAAQDSTAALIILALMAGRMLVVHWFVTPRVFSNVEYMHPVVVIIVLPIGFHLGGLVGLILAVPLAAVGRSAAQAAIEIMRRDVPDDASEFVPSWLDRAAQWSWRGIVAAAFLAMLVIVLLTFPLVLLPLILALILAATVVPLVHVLIARGQSRGTASAVAVGGSVAAILGVLALALASLVQQAPELGRTATSGADAIDEAAGGNLGIGSDAMQAGIDVGVSTISGLGDDLVGLALVIIIAVLLTFYFLRDGAGLWASLMTHLPSDAASEISAAGGRAFGVLGGYMVGTGAISFVGALSQLVIMLILNLPLALPIFVLSFFGGFIPYIGSLLTTGAAFLVAVAVGTPLDILVMGAWTAIFNIVQGNVVAPLVYNRTTSIHPAVVLAAIPAGAAVAGIPGMFLVVPALGVLATTWRSVLRVMGADESEMPGPRPVEVDEAAPAGDPPSELPR